MLNDSSRTRNWTVAPDPAIFHCCADLARSAQANRLAEWARPLELDRLRAGWNTQVPAPPVRKRARPASRSAGSIRKLLLQRDVDAIFQGVELARSLGDPSLFDELLADVQYDGELTQQLVSAKAFRGTDPAQPYLDLALRLLVAGAPSGSKGEQLRNAATSLHIPIRFNADAGRLGPLSAFPGLRKLVLAGAVLPAPCVPDVCSSSLRWLELSQWPANGADVLRQTPNLRVLVVQRGFEEQDLSALRPLADLAWVSLVGDPLAGTQGLEACERLQVLRLRQQQPLDLSGLARLPALRQLKVTRAAPAGLASIPSLSLESLCVGHCGGAPVPPAASAPTLRELRLGHASR